MQSITIPHRLGGPFAVLLGAAALLLMGAPDARADHERRVVRHGTPVQVGHADRHHRGGVIVFGHHDPRRVDHRHHRYDRRHHDRYDRRHHDRYDRRHRHDRYDRRHGHDRYDRHARRHHRYERRHDRFHDRYDRRHDRGHHRYDRKHHRHHDRWWGRSHGDSDSHAYRDHHRPKAKVHGYYCKACNRHFQSRRGLYDHVHHHHRVPLVRLPFVIVKSLFGWIFYG